MPSHICMKHKMGSCMELVWGWSHLSSFEISFQKLGLTNLGITVPTSIIHSSLKPQCRLSCFQVRLNSLLNSLNLVPPRKSFKVQRNARVSNSQHGSLMVQKFSHPTSRKYD
jgi:hypothetical protein